MKFIVAVVLFVGLVNSSPSWRFNPAASFPDKIVGGSEADLGEHKYQIHLGRTISYWGVFTSTSFGCGGSIISNKWVLTAAHCVKDSNGVTNLKPSALTIRVGQHDSTEVESHRADYQVARVIVHEGYNPQTLVNDIALLEVQGTIAFTNHVEAVGLSSNGYAPAVGTELIVSGWGTTSSGGGVTDVLHNVGVHVVSNSACNSAYSGVITAGMLCAAADGKDSCQGDSGGPIVERTAAGAITQVGVVSWGYGCADARYPGVYSDVGYFRSWITQHTSL